MIRYDLICGSGHAFDAWFSSSRDFERQRAAGLVECPYCASRDVKKQLMTPAVGRAASGREDSPAQAPAPRLVEETAPARAFVRALHEHVRAHADYVGERFAEEARRRAREKSERAVWGEAAAEEVRALRDEGIEVFPLPPLPEEGN